ncbi:MAG: glycoside hydrolase family 43 protein [Butyrivibrio sp.]|nr:glycoside hydrolase family 43 protein [Butyrivibrio sp.]
MEYGGYLFVHFTGEHKDGEQIYFSVSKDGLHWNDLNDGKLVLKSEIGEKGVRDPFIIRSPWQENKYWIIATDLRIEAGKGWGVAQYEGGRDIIVWESENLVDWTGPVSYTIGVPGAGCVWAPEAVYDKNKDAIMLFWASMTSDDMKETSDKSSYKQKIYRSYTKDFKAFTETELYTEAVNHLIDTTIIATDEGYYRYTKNESNKRVNAEFGKTLENSSFKRIESETLENIVGVEGPEIFKFNDRDEYCLILDRFAEGKGYMPLVTSDLASGEFKVLNDSEFDMGKNKKRHGGVMPITEAEYNMLLERYDFLQAT